VAAVRLLAGVGGEREWWVFTEGRVGHLRVALTPEEVDALPEGGPPVHDAGETGPERARTRL